MILVLRLFVSFRSLVPEEEKFKLPLKVFQGMDLLKL